MLYTVKVIKPYRKPLLTISESAFQYGFSFEFRKSSEWLIFSLISFYIRFLSVFCPFPDGLRNELQH